MLTRRPFGLARMAAKLAQEDANAMARAAHVLANLGKQYDLAKELVDRAVVLNPNLGSAWQIRGWVSSCVERANAPLRVLQQCFASTRSIQPEQELGLAWLVRTMFFGDFEAGYEWATRAVEAETAMYTHLRISSSTPFLRNECKRHAPPLKRCLELRPTAKLSDARQLCHTRMQIGPRG